VVDVWDALTSRRPYHPPFSRERALSIICADSGTHFDPLVVNAFLKIIDQY
jgi:HD-GYP domain-containing protein (c-di-GMP phosphodiesterase class II)